MAIALRPHHLLCMLTYVGRGYDAAFCANFDRVAGRVAAGERVEIVDGPDAICAPCAPWADAHCHRPSVSTRDEAAAREVGDLLQGAPLRSGESVRFDAVRLDRLRRAFAQGRCRSACAGCPWTPLCDEVAASGFAGTRLLAPSAPADAGGLPAPSIPIPILRSFAMPAPIPETQPLPELR